MKRKKPVQADAIRKQVEQAVLTLRRSIVIAGRQEWISMEDLSTLNGYILGIDELFVGALPVSEETDCESKACLPF